MANRIQKIDRAEFVKGGVLPTSHVSAPMPPVQPTRLPQGQASQPNTPPRTTPAPNQASTSGARPPRR